MADTGSGGWVRRAERSSAATRPWARWIGTVSAGTCGRSARMRARASSTEINPASGLSNLGLADAVGMA